MVKKAKEIWRDYSTDMVPASGKHKPIKADIRGLVGYLQRGLPFANRAELQGESIPDDVNIIYVRGSASEGVGSLNMRRLGSAPSPAKSWHTQSADGAWWEVSRDQIETAKSHGAMADFLVDDTTKLQAYFDFSLASGGESRLPSGKYKLTAAAAPCLTLDSAITDEPYASRQQMSIIGEGAGSTVLFNNTSGQYTLKLVGGTGIEAHNYENHRDFSLGGIGGSNGLWLFNKAYLSLENMTLQGFATCLLLESVLSSAFRNLRIANSSGMGVSTKKGAGFSNCNALHWDSCKFHAHPTWGYYGDTASTGLVFTSCNWEGNGTQGDGNTGQMRLVFDATEGGVAATFNGGYVESGAGAADFVFINSGSNYVTVILNGVLFNRNGSTRYTTNCIKTFGKIRLVLNGCAFRSYNGYVPSAVRPYISGDSELILNHINCIFQDAVEAPAAPAGAYRVAAYFNGTGAAGAITPIRAGNLASITKISTGYYRLTFASASGTNYFPQIVTDTAGSSVIFALSATTFEFKTLNTAGAVVDPTNISVMLYD